MRVCTWKGSLSLSVGAAAVCTVCVRARLRLCLCVLYVCVRERARLCVGIVCVCTPGGLGFRVALGLKPQGSGHVPAEKHAEEHEEPPDGACLFLDYGPVCRW